MMSSFRSSIFQVKLSHLLNHRLSLSPTHARHSNQTHERCTVYYLISTFYEDSCFQAFLADDLHLLYELNTVVM